MWIWSHILKKYLIKNFIFLCNDKLFRSKSCQEFAFFNQHFGNMETSLKQDFDKASRVTGSAPFYKGFL